MAADRNTLPEGLLTVGEGAFAYCINVKELALPDSVIRIENGAFGNCTALQTVKLPLSLKEIGAVEIPYAVETVGEAAFYGCTSLRSVLLPVTLTDIGPDAFALCGAELIFIVAPESYAARWCEENGLHHRFTYVGVGAEE